MADLRTYTATVAHVWRTEKRRPDAGANDSQHEASPSTVFQRKILLRAVQIDGLAADEQPARDEELEVFFHDEVRTMPTMSRRSILCVVSYLFVHPCHAASRPPIGPTSAVGRGMRVP